jgi:hypothetical protein
LGRLLLPPSSLHSSCGRVHALKDSADNAAAKKKASSSIKILHSALPHFIEQIDDLHVMLPPSPASSERPMALCLLDETSGSLSLIQPTNGQQVSLRSLCSSPLTNLPDCSSKDRHRDPLLLLCGDVSRNPRLQLTMWSFVFLLNRHHEAAPRHLPYRLPETNPSPSPLWGALCHLLPLHSSRLPSCEVNHLPTRREPCGHSSPGWLPLSHRARAPVVLDTATTTEPCCTSSEEASHFLSLHASQ